MIEATQDKLDEARFFLGKLRQKKQNQQQLAPTDPKVFRYYVSAFISAARSVPWALQSEEKEKYDAWIAKWDAKDSTADKELKKLTNELRRDAIHLGGAETTPISEKVALRESEHPVFGHHFSLPPGAEPPWIKVDVHYFEKNGKKEEVVASKN
jgi:hypothetical protein